VLSSSQLELLAACGEQRTAQAGETLFAIGDEDYPFIAIIEGQVAVRDGAGRRSSATAHPALSVRSTCFPARRCS
jgi:hypothetical protein